MCPYGSIRIVYSYECIRIGLGFGHVSVTSARSLCLEIGFVFHFNTANDIEDSYETTYDRRYVTVTETFLSVIDRSLPAKDWQAGASGGNETYVKNSSATAPGYPEPASRMGEANADVFLAS